jgi:phenylpropionate dioxygenase-like ring-hydroxylating dioxygenase large terminal subunit
MGVNAIDGLDVSQLIRKDAVNSRIYRDPAIFELEMERLFGRAWILVGHKSQVPHPGDYVTSRIGRTPVLIIRGEDGEIRVFYNRCTHRGARLCMMPSGSALRLVCPYHAWTYDTLGRLINVRLKEEYLEHLPYGDYGLRAVARVAQYRGFIFANKAPEGPGLLDFLGHMTTTIDDIVDRAPDDDVTVFPVPLRHRYRGNWKLTFENLNDTIHAGVAHAVIANAARNVLEGDVDAPKHPALHMMVANAKPVSFFQALDLVTAPNGHSYFGGHMGANYQPEVGDVYFQRLAAARGDARAREILAVDRHINLIYPGSTWQGRYQTVRLVHPLRVDLTEVVTFVCRLKGAPEGTFENALIYCNVASSALSSITTDDLEIYEAEQRLSSSLEDTWLPISRGMGAQRGQASDRELHAGTSEAYIRNQYRAWSAAMAVA